MADHDSPLALLNVFEVVADGVHRHLVCFLDPVLAGAQGIDNRSVVGEFEPGPNQEFELSSFRLNPAFVEAFTGYMNEAAGGSPEMAAEAVQHAGGWLYLLDPRFHDPSGAEPGAHDVMGCFAVDDAGRIVPDSFLYNENHQWFHSETGVSGVLSDRRFYEWLHPTPDPGTQPTFS